MTKRHKRRRDEYNRDHKLAKLFICTIVICLLLIDTRICDIIAVITWFFGVNSVQYIIEAVEHHKHKVQWW